MTIPARPLPKYLVQRYKGWKATDFAENSAWFERLAEEGQRPRAMIISCCDSRVHVVSIFGAEMGEFFIHRNIANLVPPYKPDGDLHGTSAAVEYAVCVLRVSHILVLGHSQCGGVEGFLGLHEDSHKLDNLQFVGRWVELLEDGYATVADEPDRDKKLRSLERAAVVTSLRNLMTFPFVEDAVARSRLSLHGLWTDIGTGGLECYDPDSGNFLPV